MDAGEVTAKLVIPLKHITGYRAYLDEVSRSLFSEQAGICIWSGFEDQLDGRIGLQVVCDLLHFDKWSEFCHPFRHISSMTHLERISLFVGPPQYNLPPLTSPYQQRYEAELASEHCRAGLFIFVRRSKIHLDGPCARKHGLLAQEHGRASRIVDHVAVAIQRETPFSLGRVVLLTIWCLRVVPPGSQASYVQLWSI